MLAVTYIDERAFWTIAYLLRADHRLIDQKPTARPRKHVSIYLWSLAQLLDKFFLKFVQLPLSYPGKPLPSLPKIIALFHDSFYYQDNNNLTSLLSPRYHPMKVEPIRNVKDIRAIKCLLGNSSRNFALFVIGIISNLRTSAILSLSVGQVRNLTLGDAVVLKNSKPGKVETSPSTYSFADNDYEEYWHKNIML